MLLLPAPGSQVRPVLAPCAHESTLYGRCLTAKLKKQGLLAGTTQGTWVHDRGTWVQDLQKKGGMVCSDPSYARSCGCMGVHVVEWTAG